MKSRLIFATFTSALLSILLASCGGGGGGSSSDTYPSQPIVQTTVTGPDRFLLFPNPQVLNDGTFETNSTAYAEAYYRAIDPTNVKDTLVKWKAANGFGTAAGPLGEVSAVFGDVRDLGYGRRMTARQNPDGTVAMMVENYLVNAGEGYSYTSLNLDAALVQDARWHIGVNAIEFSPGPNGGASFAKFYTFDPSTGARLQTASLDGRDSKAMPGICINCHGGRADPLTPPAADGKPRFPLVHNSVSQHRGDTQARMHMLNLDHLDFSTASPFRRADLEPVLKTINRMVLCTYPRPPSVPAAGVDACRPAAGAHEWQGTSAEVLKAAYGGDQMPNATFSDTYVPTAWSAAGQTSLYQNVTQPTCMTCHMQRGTAHQSDIDFTSYAKFAGYSERIKAHVFDRGNMPLAKIVAEKLFGTTAANSLATWLESLGLGYVVRDSAGTVLKPGRPIADPGPNRTVRFGPNTLSAANSLFATTYSWSFLSNPGNAGTLTNAGTVTPTFTASANGIYMIQLIASNGTTQSAPAVLSLYVNNGLAPNPSSIRFADIKPVLQGTCLACHDHLAGGAKPPIFYSNMDRNEDGTSGDATDDQWFYKELRGRINFTDIAASPILRKPSGNHHNGGQLAGFDTSQPPGHPARANYDLFLNWILNGAPQ